MLNYIKSELLERLGKLEIKRINNTVITKYYGEVIKTAEVSNIYEVFDIVNYIKNKIDLIENNFKINEYSLSIKGGVQDLKLVSDSVEINGINFSKVFYITNSTDKSRRLSFRVGLFSDRKNIHYVNSFKELEFNKKHYSGINKKVNETFQNIDKQVFDEQIESLRSLVGHQIKLSNIKKVIMGENDENIKTSDKNRFLVFKNAVLNYGMFKLDSDEKFEMYRRTCEIRHDFQLDAFNVLLSYLRIFNQKDSVILKRESKRILELTKFTIRKRLISEILSVK
jgi:hypothetical protein|tara:strand:- start:67153 stop:67998 length:846 start_codon:yes stop_codon:yes gene_type:complete